MANFPNMANMARQTFPNMARSGEEIWEYRMRGCKLSSLWMGICPRLLKMLTFFVCSLQSIDTMQGLWGQFFYLGNGKTSLDLEGNHCKVNFHIVYLYFFYVLFFLSCFSILFCNIVFEQITPTFCNAMAAFTSALDCALCEVPPKNLRI